MALHVFSLTGGIGSGKSTIAARFRARGLPVVDADQLARAAVEPASPALREIADAFGPSVLAASGALDRKALARIVFKDEAARARLNAIVHPRVRALAQAHFSELERAGEPLACYEVPLLFEVGLAESFRPVVVVGVPETEQVRRIALRDRTSESEALARIRAQLPLAAKESQADFVIENSGTPEAAGARADAVLEAICQRLGVPFERYPTP